jgi:AmmeMemoRadiSam system protein A
MPRLDDVSRKSLLQRARAAIAHAIGAERVTPAADPIPKPQSPPPPKATADLADQPPPRLRRSAGASAKAEALRAKAGLIPQELRAGAFVTIRIKGELRGCIGYPEPELPLIEVIERCAVSAAMSDPRFPALSLAEWSEIDVELSVLGPIEPVHDIADVIIGRHGLIVKFGRRRGLLLPQVAIEWKWNAVQFAAQTCVKAGLPTDAWQKGAKLFKFEAEVFGESD